MDPGQKMNAPQWQKEYACDFWSDFMPVFFLSLSVFLSRLTPLDLINL
jgi:hypothetical protein